MSKENSIHIVSDDERMADDASSSLSSGFLNDEDSYGNDNAEDHDNHRKGNPLLATVNGSEDEMIAISPEHVVERRFVTCTRLLVLMVMLGAGAVVGLITYRYVDYEQQDEMSQDYEQATLQIRAQSQARFQYTMESMSIAANVASTLAQPQDWPFVRLPKFESWAGHYQNLNLTMGVLVLDSDRFVWNVYSQSNAPVWVQESWSLQNEEASDPPPDWTNRISPHLWKHPPGADGSDIEHERFHYEATRRGHQQGIEEMGPATVYAASWQSTTPIRLEEINHNDLDNQLFRSVYEAMTDHKVSTVSQLFPCSPPSIDDTQQQQHCLWMVEPIFAEKFGQPTIVGYMKSKLPLHYFFQNALLDDTIQGIHAVVESTNPTCLGERFTIEMNGQDVTYVGIGDLHESEFDSTLVEYPLLMTGQPGATATPATDETTPEATRIAGCEYQVRLYRSSDFEAVYTEEGESALLLAGIAVAIVASVMVAFFLFDCCVRRHQRNLAKSAVKSKAIVDSLFPENVRDRLLEEDTPKNNSNHNHNAAMMMRNPFMMDTGGGGAPSSTDFLSSKPIADFFPHCTVLFADIVGFTAWSSVRDPTQVFTLLETLYNSFDAIAKKRNVFKVETIGDCYVAVTGLPEPMDDHAVVMAKFSRQCMFKMMKIVKDLEIHLGPDTGDLSMRFGLHSGPVTAGVMRGEKSRFQLFGDTVNTAARIESTGARAKIHLSEDTADLIIAAGKGHWVTAREEKVSAKGKGSLQTYFLELSAGKSSRDGGSVDLDLDDTHKEDLEASTASLGVGNLVAQFENREKMNSLDDRTRRQADYTVEMFVRILKKIGARRGLSTLRPKTTAQGSEEFKKLEDRSTSLLTVATDEVSFKCHYGTTSKLSPDKVVVPPEIITQIKDFVTTIARMYRDNPFHSFEHANHVAMSANKLFSRIGKEETNTSSQTGSSRGLGQLKRSSSRKLGQLKRSIEKTISQRSRLSDDANFGITDDPLTEFALVFAALIHDVEHPGISNHQLVTEGAPLAKKFQGKSVAEKNSIEAAWLLLMKPAYQDFRRCIYSTKSEFDRFRSLVVNLVLATDILDKNAATARSRRWEQAFERPVSGRRKKNAGSAASRDHKATLVLEHLIQAADVAHCMQHWNIYTKWNRRLFREMSEAYKLGRGKKNPAEYWFEGELSFFDTLVVPLAKRLKSCGVFGDASEEYLNYAKANRRDWQVKGRDTILDYMAENGKMAKQASLHSNTTHSTLSSSNNSAKFWPKPSSFGSIGGPAAPGSFKPTSTSSLKPSSNRSGKPPSMFNVKNRSEKGA